MEYIKSFTLRLSRVTAIRQRNLGDRRAARPLDEDTAFHSIPYSGLSSREREVTDMAQLILPAVRAAADAIPVAGGPLKAAIGGLLSVLEAIDARDQNKSDLEQILLKIESLAKCLTDAPSTQDITQMQLRQDLKRQLDETSRRLTALAQRKGLSLAYKSVTNAVAKCGNDIDSFLVQYSVALSRIYECGKLKELSDSVNEMRQIIMHGRIDPLSHATLTSVTLADASGREHTIPIEYTTSLEQLQALLGAIFEGSFPGVRVQKRYFEIGRYDLCIDQGTQVVQLTSDAAEWPIIEAGTKLIMRVIIDQEQTDSQTYKCPACDTLNLVSSEAKSGCLTRGSIECNECGGRIQLCRQKPEEETNQHSVTATSCIDSHVDNVTRACIRNFRINIIQRASLQQICGWISGPDFEPCGEIISPADIAKHLAVVHSSANMYPDHGFVCGWVGCGRMMHRRNALRHVREVHLGYNRSFGSRAKGSQSKDTQLGDLYCISENVP